MNTVSDRNELSHITNVFSYNIHGVSMNKFKQIRNYESVIYKYIFGQVVYFH